VPAAEAPATSGKAWEAVLPPPTRTAALSVARNVLARCSDPARMEAALAAAREQTGFPRSVYWEPAGIAQGDAGLALMAGYAEAAFPGEGWELVAHERMTAALRGAESADWLPAGLFSGLGGLVFTASYLSRGGARYARVLAALDAAFLPAAAAQAERLRRLPGGMSVGEFDAISGLSGVAAALLERRARRRDETVERVLVGVLGALVDMVAASDGLPRWYTPPEEMADETWARLYPQGNLNCGLAHGIPGPLAAMAIGRREGVDVPGLASAIGNVAEWLATHRADDAWGINWPSAVSVDSDRPDGPGRAAWCYGAPGVARALWLAGEALDDDALRAIAVEGMEAIYDRPLAERAIDSPTFCHGVAGLLQVTTRFASDTGLPAFVEATDKLARQLLDAYDGTRLLGYATLEPGDRPVDQPGLLDGAPGVALALLAAATATEPAWDRLFLLS
jgi:lantibiotic biosynthesis protein